jgi:hypothetical protein
MKRLAVHYRDLDLRRRELGMSYRILAELSGASLPAVQRLLSARVQDPSFPVVMAVVEALGGGTPRIMPDGSCTFEFHVSAQKIREQRATVKARKLVSLVQGTSALEAQAVRKSDYMQMLDRTRHDLLAGSSQRLWSD